MILPAYTGGDGVLKERLLEMYFQWATKSKWDLKVLKHHRDHAAIQIRGSDHLLPYVKYPQAQTLLKLLTTRTPTVGTIH